MAPEPDGRNGAGMTGEEIVISGISGHFPSSENTQKLIENLYNKVDMVKKIEYPGIKHPELPEYHGQIDGFDKFDSQFFRVTHWQATSFDPVARKIMEQAYMAMFDAGINPETLKGTKLGVFIGGSQADSATLTMYEVFKMNGFVISGCSKSMLANRISYWIDGKGPSYGLDYNCVGAMACLDFAYDRMKAGDCDTAIVGGCIHSMQPILTLNMKRAGLLCSDGKTKCFDKNGDGFVRSDALNLFFLQKAKDAKRIYAEVYHIKGKHFSSPDSLFFPNRSPEDLEKFLKEFYAETNVSPDAVKFIEANAIGIAESDANELQAIGNIFAKDRPIKVGSIKSNLGNTQPASGACSLTKLCLAYQRGEIPANLHYNEPQNQIAAIRDGKIQVVTENTPFDRTFSALNNFSMTGGNYHVLLKGHYKPKNNELLRGSIPRLVLASGRQDKCVNKILDTLENNPIDYEQIALLSNIFKQNIPGHTGRGYVVLDTAEDNKTVSLARGFEFYPGNARPVWFMFSGMGSQWATMGRDLLRIPIFAAAIERCYNVLKPKGLDIYKIITEDDKKIFDNILNSFVSITAIQIGLTDVLRAIGITPDYIIGHSAGEIACAYADGCFTAEEAILVSYFRGIASLETKMIKGAMAAIGLGHTEVRERCPPEIDIACQNSSESTTISGPAEAVDKFVAFLTSRSVFARTVPSANIAYHSRYMADAGPVLLSRMKEVLVNPKRRSKKWHSTSFVQEQWNTNPICQYASPEYFTHNLLNTVHFEETAKLIPADSIIIEIAPHGLMQAIMKRSHSNCLNIPLTKRGDKDNALYMLKAIGMIYQAGLNPDVDALYPKVEFPVSTETPVLSHLVEWEHTDRWSTISHVALQQKKITYSYEFNMSIHDDDYSLIRHFVRNGVNVFPESAILVIVWETIAMFNSECYKNISIAFNDVKFHDEVIIDPENRLSLKVDIQRGKNIFEVTQNDNLIASGFVELETNNFDDKYEKIIFEDKDNHLNATDIYKLMSMRGYCYEGEFQSIKYTNIERNKALIKWDSEWITFLDSLIQLNALSRDHDFVSSVKLINRISIDTHVHANSKHVIKNENYFGAQIFHETDLTKCGGVVVRSIVFNDIPKPEQTADVIQVRKLLPLNLKLNADFKTALQIDLQVISDIVKSKITVKLVQDNKLDFISVIKQIKNDVPTLDIEVDTAESIDAIINATDRIHVIITTNILNSTKFARINEFLRKHPYTFIVTMENQPNNINIPSNVKTMTTYNITNKQLIMLRNNNQENNVNNKHGLIYIPMDIKTKNRFVQLKNGCRTFEWEETCPLSTQNQIQVSFASLSLNADNINLRNNLKFNKNGTDFSGINAGGNRVMGLVKDNSVSSIVSVNSDFLWPVPHHWSLEEAATVPLPYIYAYYCLHIRSDLRRRNTVLITDGDSELGQALISICLDFDCTIFTTVNNIDKKKMLLRQFPDLEESKIGYSKTDQFKYIILSATQGRKCDIVVAGSRGRVREAAMKCVGFSKTYLDVSEEDMKENEYFGMSNLTEARCYKAVCFSHIYSKENFEVRKALSDMFCDGIANGVVRPLTRVVYVPTMISRAFKLLSTENHMGRVLINMKHPSIQQEDIKAMPRILLSSENLYIVVCDVSEIGVGLIDHLIERGARRFLIHMKPKLMNGYFHVKYASWKKQNVIVNFNADNLNTRSGCQNLLSQGKNQGRIDGIFLTYNEDKTRLIEQSNENYALIAANLDFASRKLNALSYFAVLLLAPCNSAYEHSFTEIEKCCYVRNDLGLPSMVLRYVTNDTNLTPDSLSRLLNAVEASLRQQYTSVLLSDSFKKATSSTNEDTPLSGFGAFFINIDEDEHIATEPLINMKTKLKNENESEIYIDPDEKQLMIVPGFDGSYQTMTDISERLKIPAVTLQLEPDYGKSISEIASRLMKIITKRFHLKSKFYILGYSFGVNVALELAALLEKQGHLGVVFCLDSSPSALKTQLNAFLGDISEQQLQNSLIEHIFNLLTHETSTTLTEKLKTTEDWLEKIEIFIKIVKKYVTHSHEFLKSLVNVAYRRILLAKEYEPNFKLNSELVLIKGSPHPKQEDLKDDYGLSRYSTKQVKVFNIKAGHTKAPQDCRVTNIVNKMLEPDLLEEFKTKNLCQYYIGS